MKIISLSLLGFILFFVPTLTFASCTTSGATIVYVNGIETTQQEADDDTALLIEKFQQYGGSSSVQIITAYNPSHLDGYGDELESISQTFNVPVSDYDLDTILTQVAQEVTTRKILLVGHSQGTFYTNEMYGYLVRNGVSTRSIAVYNIATPASVVAGGGTYLTSANDKAINYVRQLDAEANAPQALPANIIIPEELGYANNAWGGHLPEVYLDGAPERIVSDIQNALGKLSASDTGNSQSLPAQAGCFTPPQLGLSYDMQKALLTVADPTVASVDYATVDTKNTVASVMDNANDIIHTAFSDVVFSIIPKPTVQNAASAFAVEKALYGSSLSVADYEALVNGQNIPEVETPAPTPPQTPEKAQQPVSQPVQLQPVIKQEPTPPESPEAIPAAPASPLISISPGFGGGAPAVANVQSTIPSENSIQPSSSSSSTASSDQVSTSTDQKSTSTPLMDSTSTPQADSEQPAATSTSAASTTLPFSIILPANQTTFSTTSVTLSGTTSPEATVFASFGTTTASTSADANGIWSFVLELPESTTSISMNAADSSGGDSETSTLTIGVALPRVATLPMIVVTCPNFEGGGYFFDASYMQAEYVDGLLQMHLRLLTPYNDGRPFYATTIVNGSDCTSLSTNFGGGPPQTWLPAHIQYYSFRMSTPTHWILWDDEHDAQATCDVCEGDIPVGVTSVSFAAMIDSGASTLTTFPYPPTSP